MLKFITKHRLKIYHNLAQAYEAEFSYITKKLPDKNGKFFLDTELKQSYNKGFLLYEKDIPIGFVIKGKENKTNDIAEFYIIPSKRRQGLGKKMAFEIFNRYQGDWQVRQIKKAKKAYKFWKNIISEYTKNNYTDSIQDDKKWGKIHIQNFKSKK